MKEMYNAKNTTKDPSVALNKNAAGKGTFFQPKLTVNEPGDSYEQEADAMADHVMRMSDIPHNENTFFKPSVSHVQRKCQHCEEEEKMLHRKESTGDEVQGSNDLDSYISSLSSKGQPLPETSRKFFEPRFGKDFSNVRLHNDSVAAKSAQSINALAYTTGNNIVFNNGQYSPDSDSGKRLMAHELTHVVQNNSVDNSRKIKRSLINDGRFFLFVSSEKDHKITISDLVTAIEHEYHLDFAACLAIAHWLDDKYRIFDGGTSKLVSGDFRINMPRDVAFFLVDWVEPYNPFANGSTQSGDYRIQSEAFHKAQQIWARENIFVGFRPGGAIHDVLNQRINFQPKVGNDGLHLKNSQNELDLLAKHPSGSIPSGFYHIVVTGSTTQSEGVLGKSIRSSDEQPLSSNNLGILVFAQTISDSHLAQTVRKGDPGKEIAELLAHEIGHFLFNLSHGEEPTVMSTGGLFFPEKTDFMKGGSPYDPNDELGATSRQQVDQAIHTGSVPNPEVAISRKSDHDISIRRICNNCEEEEKKLQRKEAIAENQAEGSNDLDHYVGTLSSSGNSLGKSSRTFFEPRFGHDFSNVRIHNDSAAAKSAQSINALAYTTGNNIVFNSGQYSPESDSGKKLMAHELTHVVQQNSANKMLQRTAFTKRKGKNARTFQTGELRFDSGAKEDMRKLGSLLPSEDEAHIAFKGNLLGYEPSYTQPTDPFRWNKLKQIIDSNEKVMVKKIDAHDNFDTLTVSIGTRSVSKASLSLSFKALGYTLTTENLHLSAYPTDTFYIVSPDKDVNMIYYSINSLSGPASSGSLAHELLGHFWLALKHVPFVHPESGSSEEKTKGTLSSSNNIRDPFGNIYTGKVKDFIDTYIESESGVIKSPTQNVGVAEYQLAIKDFQQEFIKNSKGKLNGKWKITNKVVAKLDIVAGNYILTLTNPSGKFSEKDIINDISTWYTSIGIDKQYIFLEVLKELGTQILNKRSAFETVLLKVLVPPAGMVPDPPSTTDSGESVTPEIIQHRSK